MWKSSAYLQEAIASRNYVRIHNELCSIIHKDPTFATGDYEEAVRYLGRSGADDAIQPHDGKTLAPREEWSDDYWALVMTNLMYNFSQERAEHIKQVGRHLFGTPARASAPVSASVGSRPATTTAAAPRTAASASAPRSAPASPTSAYRPSGPSSFGRLGSYGRRNGGDASKKLGAVAIAAGVIIAAAATFGLKTVLWIAGAAAAAGLAFFLLRRSRR
ncbi:hypothetical protein [Cohnella fermenti]|uniref:Uncharacterized protein n=1 Tax=Cohnella fermenti TaxID=2565925 RepID=A0A4S4BRD1_9BACL|nr:hypothetical protein [Cohnella fermenti]THF77541.1 hypothetical protein E6C55_16115 [Cohnella fermenti]